MKMLRALRTMAMTKALTQSVRRGSPNRYRRFGRHEAQHFCIRSRIWAPTQRAYINRTVATIRTVAVAGALLRKSLAPATATTSYPTNCVIWWNWMAPTMRLPFKRPRIAAWARVWLYRHQPVIWPNGMMYACSKSRRRCARKYKGKAKPCF